MDGTLGIPNDYVSKSLTDLEANWSKVMRSTVYKGVDFIGLIFAKTIENTVSL